MKYLLLLVSLNCYAETYTTTKIGNVYTTTINQSHESGFKHYIPSLKPICNVSKDNPYSQINWFNCLNTLKIIK